MNIIFSAIESVDVDEDWCIYSHFDRSGRVEKYVHRALQSLKMTGFKVIFISTSPRIDNEDVSQLKECVELIAVRENIGYDFGSYKLGIQFLYANKIATRRILITNDSVFGPFFNLSSIIKKSEGYDLYGLTESMDHAYHLQSYFLIFNKKITDSPCFTEFWSSVDLLDASVPDFKKKIIHKYEVGGTQFFIKNKFKIGAEFKLEEIKKRVEHELIEKGENPTGDEYYKLEKFPLDGNVTHIAWRQLVEMGFPYVKRELLFKNPTYVPTDNWYKIVAKFNRIWADLIFEAMINHHGDSNFIYTNVSRRNVAEMLDVNGCVILNMDPQYRGLIDLYNLPESKKFSFDAQYYLDENPDVRAAIESCNITSPIRHFIEFGFSECRPFRLVPLL